MGFKWVGSVPSGRQINLGFQPKRLVLYFYYSGWSESNQVAYFDYENSPDYTKFMFASNVTTTPVEQTMSSSTIITSISNGIITLGSGWTTGSYIWVLAD